MSAPVSAFRHTWRSLSQELIASMVILWLAALCVIPIPLWKNALLFLRWGSVGALLLVWLTVQPAPLFARRHRPVLWFVALTFLSVLLAREPGLAWSGQLAGRQREWIGGYRDIVLMGAAWCVIATQAFQRPALQQRLSRWMLCSVILVVIIGYLEIIAHRNILYECWVPNQAYQRFLHQRRMMSTQLHPVILGALLAVCVPLALHHAATASRRGARWAGLGVTFLLIGAAIQTFTRGSLLAVLLGSGAYLLLMKRRAWLRTALIVVIAIVLGASFLGLWTRATERGRVGASRYSVEALHDIARGRTAGWRWENAALALDLVREQPFFGIGINHYRHLFSQHRPDTHLPWELHVTDNVYLKILTETGLVGALGFMWLLWGGIRSWLAGVMAAPTVQDRSHVAAIGAGWLGLLTSMVTYDGLWWLLPLAIFWIWLGILHAQPMSAAVAAGDVPAPRRATRRGGKKTRSRPGRRRFASRWTVVGELFQFLWQQRLWWMIPMAAVLLLFGALLLLAQSSPIAPFIYTLF